MGLAHFLYGVTPWIACWRDLPQVHLGLEIIAMKTALFVMCLLCATAALGQSTAAPSLQALPFSSHPQAASPQPMAQEHSLLEGVGSVTVAHGERPLWEVAPVIHEIPLGDAARAQKKEHANVKKAKVVWEN